MLFALSHALLPGYLRSGTTTEERERPLDGDAIIAHPTTGYTLAITIRASPEQVWPWVVQMGQGRGGFYTHTWVENLLGADIQNADRIMPALLDLAIGDTVRLTPNPYLGSPGQFMLVAELVPPQVLVYEQVLPTGGRTSWALVLREVGDGTTRLLSRRRGTRPSFFDRLMQPGYVFMDRGVLRGIRERTEEAW
jgi:hypothetical protein